MTTLHIEIKQTGTRLKMRAWAIDESITPLEGEAEYQLRRAIANHLAQKPKPRKRSRAAARNE